MRALTSSDTSFLTLRIRRERFTLSGQVKMPQRHLNQLFGYTELGTGSKFCLFVRSSTSTLIPFTILIRRSRYTNLLSADHAALPAPPTTRLYNQTPEPGRRCAYAQCSKSSSLTPSNMTGPPLTEYPHPLHSQISIARTLSSTTPITVSLNWFSAQPEGNDCLEDANH